MNVEKNVELAELDERVIKQFEQLKEKVLRQNPSADVERLRAAFEFSAKAHGLQKRKDGSPFVSHPLAAAEITVEMGLDEDSVIAALLHDTIEDTGVTSDEISARFGPSVANIVEGVTKLTRVQYTSKEEEEMENLRKMLMAMAKDIRVILIKIADRLHNMRTMEYQSENKQREKAKETMEIYAPIAHRLGMQKIKWELEDLSFYYLDREAYNQITSDLEDQKDHLEEFMSNVQDLISTRLQQSSIECSVYGRIKHIYSIYRKMYTQHKELTEVFDLCAFRVIVDSIADCYNVLGHIHDMFKPVPGRFKDYISTPKPNMYQSLHTTVIGEDGIPFEVQIRTWEMHHTAEYGIAAHWKYKNGGKSVRSGDEEKFAWIRRLLESQQDSDAQDFFHDLKIDMFADEVFVFTPRGDVINLPAGATPIDFAYSIHSAIGNSMTGSRVNGRLVTFDHILQNGDIVEIQTSKASKGPSRDWMKIAKSSEARNKIRQWFKKEKREENIVHGKSAFDSEMRHQGLSLDSASADVKAEILKKLSFPGLDDMYAAIGYGGLTALKAVNKIKDILIQITKPEKSLVDRISKQPSKPTRAVQGIIVEGVDNCLVKFSRCCTPIPGDSVVGFITKGYGVSVHRADCSNYLNSSSREENSGRWVPVTWASGKDDMYQTALTISAKDRDGLVLDLATALSAIKVRVRSLSACGTGAGMATASVGLEVRDLSQLNDAINRLYNVKGVMDIRRASS